MKILVVIFSLLPFLGIAQNRMVTARILDSQTKQPIKNASIRVNKIDSTYLSNHLGYFQLYVSESDTLFISHIGYLASKVKIPENNSFSILLDKKYTNLGSLDLNSFFLSADSSNSDRFIENEIGSINNSVIYKDNWQKFYKDLSNQILTSSSYHELDSAFEVSVLFTINELGNVEKISIIDLALPLSNKEIIKKSLLSLNSWTPATQIEIKTSQSFELTISRNMDVFIIVDEPAYPDGGMQSFYDFISQNMKYPLEARRMGVQGRVFVEFVVEKDGKLSNIKIVQGIGAGCDKEAIRIIQQCPNWNPGLQKGKPVKQKIVLPINFYLDNIHIRYEEEESYPILEIPRYMAGSMFEQNIYSKLKYPKKAQELGIEGRIYFTFTISKKGILMNPRQLNDIGGNLGKGVRSALLSLPSGWRPAQDDYQFILPIRYQLTDKPCVEIGEDFELPHSNLMNEIIIESNKRAITPAMRQGWGKLKD